MTSKRIFILNGHPAETSLNKTLAESYAEAARAAGHELRITHLHDLTFDMDYGLAGYAESKPLEPDLEAVMEDLSWSNHVVMTTPLWWGGVPAKLKGLIDRAFLPGRAFDTKTYPNGQPRPMLTGRGARVIITSGAPNLVLWLIYRNVMQRVIRKHIFDFVGIKPTKFTQIGEAAHAKPGAADKWIKQVKDLGSRAE